MSKRAHSESVGFKHRSALTLMTMLNSKTPKGEAAGYLSAILYLMPHDSGGSKTLCPHSTAACREMCLAGAGMSALKRQVGAKQARTDLFNQSPSVFLQGLHADIEKLKILAQREGLRPAVRLNGSSDIVWERLVRMHDRGVTFYDYTKIPLEQRLKPHDAASLADYHLTYSVGGPEDMLRALAYLEKGHSVAVVVPEDVKHHLVGLEIDLGPAAALFIDGDEHDLRFLDPPGSIVLLKPKGYIRTDLVRPDILNELRGAVRAMRAA